MKTEITNEEIWQKILDEETTQQIIDHFKFSSTANHLREEQNAIALVLLEETQRRIAETSSPDEQLKIAREARAAWHKSL